MTLASLLKLSAAVIVLGASTASAATFAGSYAVTFNSAASGLAVSVAPASGTGSFDLALGESVTFNIFDIWTDEKAVNTDDTQWKPISVNFTLVSPAAGSGTVEGGTVAQSSFHGLFQQGLLIWAGPQIISYGTSGQLKVELTDAAFNWGVFGLNEGKKHGADVYATISYISADTPAPVPLPAAGLGLVAGLGALGALRRREA